MPYTTLPTQITTKRTAVTQTKKCMLRVRVNLVEARILICVSEVSVTCFDQTEEVWHIFVISVMGGKMSISMLWSIKIKMVQVGNHQEKAQTVKDSHSENRGGEKPNQQSGTYTMKTQIVSRMSSYFSNRWPLSYLNGTKNMITHIRRQQHKKFKHQDIKQ